MKRPRPTKTSGRTTKAKTGCGSQYVTINNDEVGACEVFITLGKSGGCIGILNAVIGRLISLALRSGIEFAEILDDLDDMKCPKSYEGAKSSPQCIADAINKYMELENGTI